MQKPTHTALLVGSPRGPRSTSNSIGTYLVEKLEQKGVSYKKVYIRPLYVDSLHSQVIETLELIAEHEKGKQDLDKKSFVAISNGGFPEAKQNSIALTICRLFAKQIGFNWAVGLAWGGGGMIAGEPLSEFGFRIRGKTKALEIAADSLVLGDPIPEKAVALISKLGVIRRVYLWMANRRWKRQAKKNIPIKKMYDQPLKESLK